MLHRLLSLALVATLSLSGSVAAARPAASSYRVAAPMPGLGDGSWDYARVDRGILYVAHDAVVSRFDLHRRIALPTIGDIAHGHAVVPLPDGRSLAVTSGHDASVRIIDRNSGSALASIGVGAKPDAALIDPGTGHLLSMDADAGTVSEIDLAARRVVRTIHVRDALEYAAIGRGRILFINDEDANEMEVVDLVAGATRAPIALPGCEAPTGLAYDARTDRLVAACANGQAAIVDAHTRRLVQLVPIALGPDAVLIDPRRGVALIPCGADGVLDVLSLAGRTVTRIARVSTETGARTGAIDPATGIVYLPTARFGPAPAGHERAPILPGSFHIVVVRPS